MPARKKRSGGDHARGPRTAGRCGPPDPRYVWAWAAWSSLCKSKQNYSEPKARLKTSDEIFRRLSQDPFWGAAANFVRIGYWDRVLQGFLETSLKGFVPLTKGGDLPWHRVWWFRVSCTIPSGVLAQSLDSHTAESAAVEEEVIFPRGAAIEEDVVCPCITQEELRLTNNLLWDRASRLDLVFRTGDTACLLRDLLLAEAAQRESAIKVTWSKNINMAITNVQSVEEERQHLRDVRQANRTTRARNAIAASNAARRTRMEDAAGPPESDSSDDGEGDCKSSDDGRGQFGCCPLLDLGFTFSAVHITCGSTFSLSRGHGAGSSSHSKKDAPASTYKIISQNVLMDSYVFTGRENSPARWSKLLDFLAAQDADFYVLQEVNAAFVTVLAGKMGIEKGGKVVDIANHSAGVEQHDRFWAHFNYAHSSLDLPNCGYGQLILSRLPIAYAGELELGIAKRALFCEVRLNYASSCNLEDGEAASDVTRPLLLAALHLTSDHHAALSHAGKDNNAHKRLFQLAQVRNFVKSYTHVVSSGQSHALIPDVVLAGDFNEDSLISVGAEASDSLTFSPASVEANGTISDDVADAEMLRSCKVLGFLSCATSTLEWPAFTLASTDGKPSFEPEVNLLANETSSHNRRGRRIDHVAFSGSLVQVGVATAVTCESLEQCEILSDHSAVVCEFLAPSSAFNVVAGMHDSFLSRLISQRRDAHRHLGFAWLVPSEIEPVVRKQGIAETDTDSSSLHEMLYSVVCSRSQGSDASLRKSEENTTSSGENMARLIHGRIGAFHAFVQSVRSTADSRYNVWPPHVTLLPPFLDLSFSLEALACEDLAAFVDSPAVSSKDGILAMSSLCKRLDNHFNRKTPSRLRRRLWKCLTQEIPLPHTEFVPGVLEHGKSASVVLFAIGETDAAFKSIYKKLYQEALLPSTISSLGKARVDTLSFTPHLTLASDMSLMEANALVGSLRKRMRDAYSDGSGNANDNRLNSFSSVVAKSTSSAVYGDDLILVGPPLTSIAAVERNPSDGALYESKRLFLRNWPVPESAGALSKRVLRTLNSRFQKSDLEFYPIGGIALGLDDSGTGDFDLAVKRTKTTSISEPKDNSVLGILHEIKKGIQNVSQNDIETLHFSKLRVVEDAKIRILRAVATLGKMSTTVEIQVGLCSYEFELKFRERLLSTMYARALDYESTFLQAVKKLRLWAKNTHVYGQAYGFPPGVFWSLLVLDGVLLWSVDVEPKKQSQRNGTLDFVFRHILNSGKTDMFDRPFLLPETSVNVLRNLTSFSKPWLLEAIRRSAEVGLLEHDIQREVDSGDTISKLLFANGLSHAVVVQSSEAWQSNVLRCAGDLFFEAKCTKVRPFDVRWNQKSNSAFVIGVSCSGGRESAVTRVVERWNAQFLAAEDISVRGSVELSTPERPRLLMLVGLPGSGKSTFSNAIVQATCRGTKAKMVDDNIEDLTMTNCPWEVISQDDIGSRRSCEDAMCHIFRKSDRNSGKSVILDRCNCCPLDRRRWLEMAQLGQAEVVAVFFDFTADDCRKRVASREIHPTIPKGGGAAAVEHHSRLLQIPMCEEGFRRVHVVRNFAEASALADFYGSI